MSRGSKKEEVGYGTLRFQKVRKKCMVCWLNQYPSGAALFQNDIERECGMAAYFSKGTFHIFQKRYFQGDGLYGKPR
jgi:hypothetical protein